MKRLLRKLLTAIVPRRFWLPLMYWNQRRLRGIEPEILIMRRFARPGGVAVDIGANSGLYTYELSRWFERVEAFEPNLKVSQTLRDWGKATVRLWPVGISSVDRVAVLHMPISMTGVEYAGWGTLDRGLLKDLEIVHSVDVDLVSLDSIGLINVAIVKIDVEGHEQDVLDGARRTIDQSRPIILLEVKSQSRDYVVSYFKNRNYTLHYLENNELKVLPYDLEKERWPRENVFAIPAHNASIP